MQIKEFIKIFEKEVPTYYKEDFDKVGLQIGDPKNDISSILTTLDITEDVINEAIDMGSNFILAFHPLIFSPLQKLTLGNRIERCIQLAIKNDISIYIAHTNLDKHMNGVNEDLCKRLNIKNTEFLIPDENIMKLQMYVPIEYSKKLSQALFDKGAGKIGEYSNCSFYHNGKGTFLPSDNSTPFVGKKNELHEEEETCLQMIFATHLKYDILKAIEETHPYEKPAFEISNISNGDSTTGVGKIGYLEKETTLNEFIKKIKKLFDLEIIRISKPVDLNKKIEKVAMIAGSGAFGIDVAKAKKADLYLTADLKYHDFFNDSNTTLLDIGHFEMESYVPDLFIKIVNEIAPKIQIQKSKVNTNPIDYIK